MFFFFTQIELKHTKLLIALKIVWYDDSRAKPNEFTLNLKIEKTDIRTRCYSQQNQSGIASLRLRIMFKRIIEMNVNVW